MTETNNIYTQDIKPEDEGKYHTSRIYDDEDNEIGWEYTLDDVGRKIPLELCICAADNPSECGCDCNSWTNYHYEDDGWYEEEMKWLEHREMSYSGNYDNF